MNLKKYCGIILLLMAFLNNYSQERIVKGIVTTFDSIPLINAEVKVKSSKQVVLTDTLGNFQATCLPDDKLKVSAKGFSSRNVKLNEKIRIVMVNLRLKPTPKSREIAIGYGHVSDKEKLYSISSLDNDDIDFSIYSNMYDLIRGRFPNVQVTGNEIIIRGRSSINLSNSALIVVDGIVVSNDYLSTLPPNNVKSIDILKDASSAAYGSRGANGVVIIETKRGGD